MRALSRRIAAGKSDPGDALAIARVTLRETGLGPISMPGLTEDLKLLVDARDQRVIERTRVTNRLHAQLVVLARVMREIPELTSPAHLAAIEDLVGHLAGVRAELARAELRRLQDLRAEPTGSLSSPCGLGYQPTRRIGARSRSRTRSRHRVSSAGPADSTQKGSETTSFGRGHKTDRHDRGERNDRKMLAL